MIKPGQKRKTFRLSPELAEKIPQLKRGINILVKAPPRKKEKKTEERLRYTVSIDLSTEKEIKELAALYKVSQNDVVTMALLLI